MSAAPFRLLRPVRQTTCTVFASPHSGRDYPAAFLRQSVLDEREIRTSEDAFVDQLLGSVPRFGAPLLVADVPRAYVDLNRACDELDPALVEGVARRGHNPRVSSGLGVVPRVVAGGKPIYRGTIARSEAEGRIDRCWHPYHAQLLALLDETRTRFGEAILLDVHSMPHEAIESIASLGVRRPEVVLGDRFGASAGGDIVDRIEAAFQAAGLRVMRNAPFAGAYVVQTYGRPSARLHAVQIELDRSLYMNEREIRPNGNFAGFRRVLDGVLAEIASLGAPGSQSLAAE